MSSTFLSASRVEKYRPQVLDDIVGNQETIDRLKVIAKDGNCPHIVISVKTHHTVLIKAQWTVSRECLGLGKRPAYIAWLTNSWATRIKRVSWSSTPPTKGLNLRTPAN